VIPFPHVPPRGEVSRPAARTGAPGRRPRVPEKYEDAIVRAADQCTVKRYILAPPAFAVTAVPAGREGAVEA